MKTFTVEEAKSGLARWVDRELGGQQIRIRRGDAVVGVRPAQSPASVDTESLSPREALRRLQEEARLKPEQAEQYLREVREERLAAEGPRRTRSISNSTRPDGGAVHGLIASSRRRRSGRRRKSQPSISRISNCSCHTG
ncbi:MAG: hypothetical protein FJ398_03565 [Verrucomicrobia bacterium]|nr:hypothetical protein [Verrucomicrobiota bacterium]